MKKIFLNEKQLKKIKEASIDLDSFDVNDDLVEKIWENDKISRKVRKKLLQIAQDFIDYTEIDWVKPKKIVIVGSICNYNWSKYSDIDLHIVMDYKKIDNRTDFVQDYFDAKKNLWNEEHEDLTIFGYPVEIYVQDVSEKPESEGEYDLTNDKWVKKPQKDEDAEDKIESNKNQIKGISLEIIRKIENLENEVKNTSNYDKLEDLQKESDDIFDDLKKRRQKGLSSKDGEYSVGNLVYKCIRRSGHFDRLWDLSSIIYDKMNSINENKGIFETIRRGDLLMLVNEEVNADGNSAHNPYAKRWKQEREMLKNFILNNGSLMTSKENGKTYKVYFESAISNLIGANYALCLQYDPTTMEYGSTVYIRALDKFTERMFQANFDTRGRDNVEGTQDDVV